MVHVIVHSNGKYAWEDNMQNIAVVSVAMASILVPIVIGAVLCIVVGVKP